MADYKVLIFDWDGTLVNSIAPIVQAVQEAVELCGLPTCESSSVKALIGLGLPEVLASLYPERNVMPYYAAFRSAYLKAHHALEVTPSPYFEGVLEGLHQLHDQGFALAVATGKSRMALDRQLKLRGLESFFKLTRCADETASKPDPLMLKHILMHCDVTSRQALMVGDTGFDLAMAQNATMDAVAVSYGAQDAAALAMYRPKRVIDQFTQLVHWLDGSPAT